jgi:hypothetical protein
MDAPLAAWAADREESSDAVLKDLRFQKQTVALLELLDEESEEEEEDEEEEEEDA